MYRPITKFQSHNGSIQSLTGKITCSAFRSVSIPQWFDSKFSLPDLVGIIWSVSIPQWFDSKPAQPQVLPILYPVSIPQWFDSNSATRLEVEFEIHVSIPQWFDSNAAIVAVGAEREKFQSHNGSIQIYQKGIESPRKDVSIPQWFDSNDIPNNTLAYLNSFQSHNGSIQMNPKLECFFLPLRFQSHNGSIQIILPTFDSLSCISFNPTMVRFKLGEWICWRWAH